MYSTMSVKELRTAYEELKEEFRLTSTMAEDEQLEKLEKALLEECYRRFGVYSIYPLL